MYVESIALVPLIEFLEWYKDMKRAIIDMDESRIELQADVDRLDDQRIRSEEIDEQAN